MPKIYPIFILSFTIFTTSFLSAKANASPSPTPEVFIEEVVSKPLFEELSFPARVESQIQAKVQALTDGIVTEVAVAIGARVKKGQLLFRIRKNDPGYQYAPVRVIAPVDGMVSLVAPSLGSEVSRGAVVAEITDPARVKAKIEITANDMALIHTGLKGELVFSGLAQPVPVSVAGVSPQVDSSTGTASAELHLALNTGVQPGALGLARFRVNERNGFQLPDHAIRYKGDQAFIRVIEGEGVASTARRQNIQLGQRTQGVVEVLSGLKPGDRVVLRSSTFIADGEKVKVSEEKTEK